MKEEYEDQPRIICFDKIKKPISSEFGESQNITILHGNLIEGSKRFADNFYNFPVIAIKEDIDKKMMKDIYPSYDYNINDQVDIFDSTDKNRRKTIKGEEYNFSIHDYVLGYINNGIYDL